MFKNHTILIPTMVFKWQSILVPNLKHFLYNEKKRIKKSLEFKTHFLPCLTCFFLGHPCSWLWVSVSTYCSFTLVGAWKDPFLNWLTEELPVTDIGRVPQLFSPFFSNYKLNFFHLESFSLGRFTTRILKREREKTPLLSVRIVLFSPNFIFLVISFLFPFQLLWNALCRRGQEGFSKFCSTKDHSWGQGQLSSVGCAKKISGVPAF